MTEIRETQSRILDFGRIAGKLKRIKRKGWLTVASIENSESVADHTFRTAILAMCISDLKRLDMDKLVRMALLHDVHEALIGDYDHCDKEQMGESELRNVEDKAIKRVFSALPESLREKYIRLSLEFQRQETAEAKLVKQIDLLEMLIQAAEYEEEGYDREKLQTFWSHAEETLEDTDLKRLFKLLEENRSRRTDLTKELNTDSTSTRTPRRVKKQRRRKRGE